MLAGFIGHPLLRLAEQEGNTTDILTSTINAKIIFFMTLNFEYKRNPLPGCCILKYDFLQTGRHLSYL